jgi:hypothetical protein
VFYFQQLLNTALGGIDATSIIATVRGIAFAILLISFLIGLYQAALRGGDLQALAVTAIKYLIVALIIANWSTVFRDLNSSFNAVANSIGNSSSAGDMFMNWLTQLQQQAQNNPNLSFWDLVSGDTAGVITVGLLLIAYILYALAIIVFCFFYTLFGAVLYVMGPLVLALIPIAGVGQLGRAYAVNLMIWNAWGILYAVFGALITAIHFNQVSDVMGNGFLGFLRGVPDSWILGLVSIFYALAIALIPLIAKRIISGDVGSATFALVRAGTVAAGAALAGASGLSAGASAGSASGASAGAGGGTAAAGAGAGGGSSAVASAASGSMPPPAPSMAEFLRAGMGRGMSSEVSSDTGPPAPSAAVGSTPADAQQTSAVTAGGGRSSFNYRPRGVVQTITYNAGRVVGKAAGKRSDEGDE